MDSIKLTGISFHSAGKIFDFDARELELVLGDMVIVETERGRALGRVVSPPRDVPASDAPAKLKGVLRKANDGDLAMAENNAQREADALRFCSHRAHERKLEMKLVRAEYLYDGSKIIFYFTADGRIDFRDLVRDLAQHFRTRIEMRQIGVRDEAKLVGGLGVCGRELCCCTFLRDFAPVSVKMAKAQGLALNPTKISGQCGRLLCCLAYEYETYSDLRKNLPKCGKKVQLESGPAEVIAVDVLGQKFTACCSNGDRCVVKLADLKKMQEKGAEEKPSAAEAASEARPAPAAPAAEKPTDKGERREGRRSRNRRPKAPQGSAESRTEPREKRAEAPQQKSAPPQTTPDGDKDGTQNRRRRNRRRNRRRGGGSGDKPAGDSND